MKINEPDYGGYMICPFCGCEEVHIKGFAINSGGQVISYIENKLKLDSAEPMGRGTAYNMYYFCENSCAWSENYHFHKGTSFKNLTLIEKNCSDYAELWRD